MERNGPETEYDSTNITTPRTQGNIAVPAFQPGDPNIPQDRSQNGYDPYAAQGIPPYQGGAEWSSAEYGRSDGNNGENGGNGVGDVEEENDGEEGGEEEKKGYCDLLLAEFVHWAQTEGTFWAASFGIHSVLMTIMMFVGSSVASRVEEPVVAIEEAEIDLTDSEPIDVYRFTEEIPEDDLDMAASLTELQGAQEEIFYDDSDTFEMGGGGLAEVDPAE
ncbi:MAG: hypothetical protein Q4C47_01910, partial [Planctomycetia bacterium]|nr:hypothetical protein [Planctomycetia bacterium]